MAPSGEHRPEDLGQATVRSAAVATGKAATTLRERVTSLSRHASGKTVTEQLEIITKQAGIAEKTAANLSTVADALQIREAAAKAWNTNAPKDSEIDAAKKAVADAQQQLKDAAAASGDTSAASSALEAAQKKLGELIRRRRDADRAYDDAEKRAQEKLKTLTRDEHGVDGRAGTPDGTPSTGSTSPSPSTGTGSPSTGNGKPSTGTPSKTPASGTAKPSTTPPSTTETTTSTATPDSTAALAALLASQQQQQPAAQAQQAQPTAATPAAAAPVASTPTQPDKDKDLAQSKTSPWDRIVGADGILDTGDLATLGVGAPLTLGGGSAPTHATPAATVTPSAPATPTPSPTGLSASATANAQPVTSGNSATGLNTATDVSGRAGEPRGPFSVGPETKTSGASGATGTSASPAHATGTRPMSGGMPMMPMGAMGGPAGGAGRDREQAQTVSAAGNPESDALHGRHTVAEAVPGGTIAQKDHPRRRGEDAA